MALGHGRGFDISPFDSLLHISHSYIDVLLLWNFGNLASGTTAVVWESKLSHRKLEGVFQAEDEGLQVNRCG